MSTLGNSRKFDALSPLMLRLVNRLVIAQYLRCQSLEDKGISRANQICTTRPLCAIYCCDRVKVNRGDDKRDPFVEGDI